MSIEEPKVQKIEFAGTRISIESEVNGRTFNIRDRLAHPEDFHGDPNVHHLVKFGGAFETLIGRHSWPLREEELRDKGVVILEQHYPDEARPILNGISSLAAKVIQDNSLYADSKFGDDYFTLVRKGYDVLRKHEAEFGLNHNNAITVSLERAGLVCARASLGLGKDAEIPGEVRVVTKRTHLNGEPESHLAVSVKWRDSEALKSVNRRTIEIPDTVSPASGSSELAFILAASQQEVKPATVVTRSVMVTRQGIIFVRDQFLKMGIQPVFYSLGESDELNNMYYLVGRNGDGESRIVADAGDALQQSLPRWYKD